MSLEVVTVVCNGREYQEWESIRIEWTIGEPDAPVAMLTTSEVIERKHGESVDPEDVFEMWNFPPGAFVSIFGNYHELLMHGFVYAYMPAVDAEQHSIQIVVKSLAKNFVASTAFLESMHVEGITDLDFANLLAAPFGVTVLDRTIPFLIKKYQISMGMSNFAALMRILQPRGKTLYTSRDGKLVITDGTSFAEESLQRGFLVQGVNIIKMAAKLTDEGFWDNEIIGQSAEGVDLATMLQPGGFGSFSMGRLYRMILNQTATDPEIAQLHAEWVSRRQHHRSVSAEVTVAGWRKPTVDGGFWDLDTDAYIYAPYLKIDCIMRIHKIVYSQAIGEGTTTQLTLVSPSMHNAGVICESGPMWLYPPFFGFPRDPSEPYEQLPPPDPNPQPGDPM